MGNSTVSGPFGFQPGVDECVAINRTEATARIGEVVQFDMGQSDVDVSNGTVGDENSSLSNVIQPVTAQLRSGIFGIVVGGTLTNNGRLIVRLRGQVQAFVEGTDAVGLNDDLTPRNGQDELFSDAVTGGEKIVAKPLETSAAGTEELISVLFNGVEGFGQSE